MASTGWGQRGGGFWASESGKLSPVDGLYA